MSGPGASLQVKKLMFLKPKERKGGLQQGEFKGTAKNTSPKDL